MPRFRLVSTTVVMLAVLTGAGFGAAQLLPLEIRLQAAQAGTRLEIRLAEAAPGAGLVEVAVPGTRQPVYVHGETLVTGADVKSARVIEREAAQFDVAITFKEPAAARLARATRPHVGRPMVVLLDGRVIGAPLLKAPIGETAIINGLFTADEARALAESLAPGSAQPAVTVRVGQVIPPRLLQTAKPRYTRAAMSAGVQGTVVLEAIVNADGTVSDIAVIDSLDREHGLDEEAVRTVKQWKFEPGMRNGAPVAVLVRLELEFNLRSSK